MTIRPRICQLIAIAALVATAACDDPVEETPPCIGEGVICHVAGTGAQAFNGDDLPPAESALNLPSAARVGPDELLYIMDFNNMRLRCRIASGVLDTIAGSGVHAFARINRNALESPLENPIDFDFLPDGRIVMVSLHDPRLLLVDSDGTLLSIAGTGDVGDGGDGLEAHRATFVELAAIAVAGDGSIFVSDDGANRVRVLRPDGNVYPYAGTGDKGAAGDGGPALDAQLNHPEGIAVDADGNLYIADTYNHRIVRVDAVSGNIDTVAGTGSEGLSGDGGPALEAALHWPSGVDVAPDGTLYIADTLNHRVRHIDGAGTITTVAGSDRGHAGDGGPATAAQLKGPRYIDVTDDALYIADQQNQVVRMVHLR